MATDATLDDEANVLRSKRNATRYQILVGIAEHQPAVSQREIAESIGITAQAVSDYLQDLTGKGYVEKHGRGRYEITKEGVDWLISQTDELREFVDHVSKEVIGQVEIETAIATAPIGEGQSVSLTMRDGVLHATPGETGSTTAVAITAADTGEDLGVTDFEGLLDYDPGTVTILSIPRVANGGSRAVDPAVVTGEAATHDILATAGVEALVASRAADLDPDIQFGTTVAVREAAMRGLDVLLLTTTADVSSHTNALSEGSVSYEVVEVTDG